MDNNNNNVQLGPAQGPALAKLFDIQIRGKNPADSSELLTGTPRRKLVERNYQPRMNLPCPTGPTPVPNLVVCLVV